MEFQIILLPRADYWAWVRACKEYALTFGVNLTADPSTAASYMAPRQVVTVPNRPGGFPEIGDVSAWFLAHHEGVRLDVIEAGTPEELEKELNQRAADRDRFGQRRRPFYLLWPSDYPVITQPFGANPQIYTRYGMPGHEGVDIRALPNTNIYACAEGSVYQVHTGATDHAYGIHIRIQHGMGYKTIYGHLARALVREGESVQAGQVIGKADSTGSSSASHLHLSLKRQGATDRGETRYPKDIIDPTPFLVWPGGAPAKGVTEFDWPAGRCLVGAHARIGGILEEHDLEAVGLARLEAVKLSQRESRETIERLRAMAPSVFLMARLTHGFGRGGVSSETFASAIEGDLGRLVRLGVEYFEIHASPNLQVEGWGRSWVGGREFAAWYLRVLEQLRAVHPEVRFGFPGLAPGGAVSGQREDALAFLEEADEALQASDWIGVNCYWSDAEGRSSLRGGRLVDEYRLRFPRHVLFVGEFGNLSAGVSAAHKAEEYVEFYRRLRAQPGVGAAFAYALSAAQGHTPLVWRQEGDSESEIARRVGERAF